MAKTSGDFRFRRGDTVGAADAENDDVFLKDCFVDNGDLSILLSCDDPHCIVVGRTGSGKTALLLEIERQAAGHTERVAPESFSFNYIANSDALNIVTELGVNLDPFFKLLWRHVLAVTIFQHLQPATGQEKSEGLISRILRMLRADKTTEEKAARHRRVLEFLERYGGTEFWADVGQRVQAIVYKFEKEFDDQTSSKSTDNLNVTTGAVKGSVGIEESVKNQNRRKLVTECSVEQKDRFQHIVNEMHVKELEGILDLVSEVMEDAGRNIYVIIDRLDLNWVDESMRFRLIRALIDTAIAFARVKRVKIILAMRADLIERVYRDSRQFPGVQSEKLKDYCLTLFWDRHGLLNLLDSRVSRLVKDRYVASFKVGLRNILNPKIRKGRQKGVNTIDYILDRTWLRPRDVIDFFNSCIARSTGNVKITDDALLEAEGEYSLRRLRSLTEEWQLEYAYLEETMKTLLNGRSRRFHLNEISDESLIEWMTLVVAKLVIAGDRIRPIAQSFNHGLISFDQVRVELATILYKVGCVGIQNDETEKPQWAGNFGYSLSGSEIRLSSFLYVHSGLWKALGIV